MTDNVVPFIGVTRLDTPPERVIDGAGKANLSDVVIVGFTEDGDFYFASNKADAGDVVWLLEQAKFKLLRMCDDDT